MCVQLYMRIKSRYYHTELNIFPSFRRVLELLLPNYATFLEEFTSPETLRAAFSTMMREERNITKRGSFASMLRLGTSDDCPMPINNKPPHSRTHRVLIIGYNTSIIPEFHKGPEWWWRVESCISDRKDPNNKPNAVYHQAFPTKTNDFCNCASFDR